MGQNGQLYVDVQVENGESDGGQRSISANIYIIYTLFNCKTSKIYFKFILNFI